MNCPSYGHEGGGMVCYAGREFDRAYAGDLPETSRKFGRIVYQEGSHAGAGNTLRAR